MVFKKPFNTTKLPPRTSTRYAGPWEVVNVVLERLSLRLNSTAAGFASAKLCGRQVAEKDMRPVVSICKKRLKSNCRCTGHFSQTGSSEETFTLPQNLV